MNEEFQHQLVDVYRWDDGDPDNMPTLPITTKISDGAGDDGVVVYGPISTTEPGDDEWGVIIENQNGMPVIMVWPKGFQQGNDPHVKIIIDGTNSEFPGYIKEIKL